MKTLYVSDMDGTLLGPDSRVSETTATIVSDLTRQGALITVATARTAATVVPLLAEMLTTPPAIVMTGAAMWDRGLEKYRDVKFLGREAMDAISGICNEAGLHPFIYVMGDDRFLDVYHDGPSLSQVETSFYNERAHLRLKRFHLRSGLPEESRTVLWYAMGAHEAIFAAAERLADTPGLAISCYHDIFDHSIGHLEIFAEGVSKASAVMALKSKIGAERLVVFGDNLNDLPMMSVADVAVAVGNAFDEVKDMADAVIGPNSDDSVARFILSDFKNGL